MLHGLYPHDNFFGSPRAHVRTPPRSVPVTSSRRQPTSRDVAPQVKISETTEAFKIELTPPSQTWSLIDARASLSDDARTVVLEGGLVKKSDGFFQYQTRDRVGVYSQPSQHALVGVVHQGQVLHGGAPSSSGWIALADGDSWVLDDGTLALVGRPAPSRPTPFDKRVALPADAEPRRATSSDGNRGDGGLIVSVPRARRARAAPAPRHVESANVKRRPPAQQPPPEQPRPAAKATPAAASSDSVSADEFKQHHKRQASERRNMHDALRSLLGGDEAGALLVECDVDDVSERHVQSPSEQVEEWVACTDGSFVRHRHEADDELVHACAPPRTPTRKAAATASKTHADEVMEECTEKGTDEVDSEWDDMADELAYWGF